jgi:tetratricopeptide (TPR) repeat protein
LNAVRSHPVRRAVGCRQPFAVICRAATVNNSPAIAKASAGLDIATALVQAAPDDPDGWIGRSFALHEMKRTEEARDYLQRVVDKFPKISVIRYNLACYECQLGSLEKARDWLAKAFKVGDTKAIKRMALDDRDLEPLWKEIGNS